MLILFSRILPRSHISEIRAVAKSNHQTQIYEKVFWPTSKRMLRWLSHFKMCLLLLSEPIPETINTAHAWSELSQWLLSSPEELFDKVDLFISVIYRLLTYPTIPWEIFLGSRLSSRPRPLIWEWAPIRSIRVISLTSWTFEWIPEVDICSENVLESFNFKLLINDLADEFKGDGCAVQRL